MVGLWGCSREWVGLSEWVMPGRGEVDVGFQGYERAQRAHVYPPSV